MPTDKEIVSEALKESEDYHGVLEYAKETENDDLFSAFLSYHNLHSDSEVSPFLFLKSVLESRGELSVEEIVLLLCNISGVFFDEIFE